MRYLENFGRPFKTKVGVDELDVYYLFLPTGELVASGTASHVLFERGVWEDVLSHSFEPVQLEINFDYGNDYGNKSI